MASVADSSLNTDVDSEAAAVVTHTVVIDTQEKGSSLIHIDSFALPDEKNSIGLNAYAGRVFRTIKSVET